METLVLAVLAMMAVVVFFGGFTGFIIGDNVENKLVISLFAVIPAAIIFLITPVPLLSLLWVASFSLGYIIGWIMR